MTPTSTRRRPQGPAGSTLRSAGFTLIELMIAVAVIGILAAIAYPSYTRYVREARVTDGQSLLMNVAGRMERCYTVNNSYTGCIENGEFSLQSDEEYYEITEENFTASDSSFTIRATGDSDQVKCRWLEINHQGERSSDNDCW